MHSSKFCAVGSVIWHNAYANYDKCLGLGFIYRIDEWVYVLNCNLLWLLMVLNSFCCVSWHNISFIIPKFVSVFSYILWINFFNYATMWLLMVQMRKTLDATMQTLQDMFTVEDFDMSDAFQHSRSSESLKLASSETYISKVNIAKKRASQQETEVFYFTVSSCHLHFSYKIKRKVWPSSGNASSHFSAWLAFRSFVSSFYKAKYEKALRMSKLFLKTLSSSI